jgi:hypothetical protein
MARRNPDSAVFNDPAADVASVGIVSGCDEPLGFQLGGRWN